MNLSASVKDNPELSNRIENLIPQISSSDNLDNVASSLRDIQKEVFK